MPEFSDRDKSRIAFAVQMAERALRNSRPRLSRQRIEGNRYDRVKGLLVGAMATTDTTHTIDNVTRTKGPSPLVDPSSTTETLTVQNTDHDWKGDDNAVAQAEYNEVDGLWYLSMVSCPA